MLGIFCARPKPWILTTALSLFHQSAAHHNNRLFQSPINFGAEDCLRRRNHTSACWLGGGSAGGAASIWHGIFPSGAGRRSYLGPVIHQGEGSWNVAWDARPARWLHRPDSAWLLFGVCNCLAPPLNCGDFNHDVVAIDEKIDGRDLNDTFPDEKSKNSDGYRVTGVLADGRCLFRAIAHGACLRSGEEAPNELRQRELADELRAQVVEELLRRRKETEWFIEGDFDVYVKRIQQPYVWGGEPELLMASHVLKTPISVFMIDRNSSGLINIANYGEEYQKEEESPINVLFHGYGHYDLVETLSNRCLPNAKQ